MGGGLQGKRAEGQEAQPGQRGQCLVRFPKAEPKMAVLVRWSLEMGSQEKG